MIKNHRVVVCVPAGRRRYMELLLPYLLREKSWVDEIRFWANTSDVDDLGWMRMKEAMYPGLVRVQDHPDNAPTGHGLGLFPFYREAHDPNTVYVRIDDDVVWIEEGGLLSLVEYRLAHPEFWLVSANMINGAIPSHLHQRLGALPLPAQIGDFGYSCMDEVGWRNAEVCEKVHRIFLKNLRENPTLPLYRFGQWILKDYERFSINFISWLGVDMDRFGGNILQDEEHEMAVERARTIGKPCVILASCMASHYAFFIQRDVIDRTDILAEYTKLSEALYAR